MKKIIFLFSFFFFLFSNQALAVSNKVELTTDTSIKLNNTGLYFTLKSGSIFDKLIVNNDNFEILTGLGDVVTIQSADRKNLSNNGGLQTDCPNSSNPSSLVIRNAGDITITPSASQCTIQSSGGGGGGSYIAPVITSTSTATTTMSVATTTVISGNIKTVTKEYIESVIKAEEKLVKKIDNVLTKRLAGRILLQTETNGQAWYLDPISFKRYYLADGQSSFDALRKFGLGIKDTDIAKIPVGLESRFTMTDSDSDGLPDKLEEAIGTDPNKADTDGDGFLDGDEVKNGYNPNGVNKLSFSVPLINRLKGRIVIQTESKGEAWYINPVNGKRYYLANGEAAYQIMRYLSLGISNANIQKIQVSELK